MIQVRFLDDRSMEVFTTKGEKVVWSTFFPVPKEYQNYFASRMEFYYNDYYKEERAMSVGYWVWLRMNYDERLGIHGGAGPWDDENDLISRERIRIGLRIRELRKKKNFEAKKLAKVADIDPANLARIEQGRYSVGVDVLYRIAVALGARIEMVDYIEPKNS